MKLNKPLQIAVSVAAVFLIVAAVTLVGLQSYAPKINQTQDITKVDISTPSIEYIPQTESTTTGVEVDQNNPIPEIVPPPDSWELVENKKYGFSYRRPAADSDEYFFVETIESAKNLKSFVQDIWSLNKNETSSFSKGKKISELSEIIVNGSQGYQFSLSGSYTWDEQGSGYILDTRSLFTFFETKQGIKIVTRSPMNVTANQSGDNYSVQILNSFHIDEKLIPKNEAPTNWQKVQKDSFTFKFPSNLFKIDSEYSTERKIYLADIAEGMRGGIFITPTSEKFDPDNIIDMYGKIENPDKIMIGDRIWYSYVWGDAGAAARIYLTSNGTDQSLKVSFSSMPGENVYPLNTDIELHKLILATFSK